MKHYGTLEAVRKEKDSLIAECSGYSTVFDALFLLLLISLAGVLLMPSLQAEKQYAAAGYVTSSELDTYMLESLLSCKLDDFEYEISPLSALNISMPESSVVKNPSYTLFGKEQKHRTFADLTAEYLALSLKISNSGSKNSSKNSSNNSSNNSLNNGSNNSLNNGSNNGLNNGSNNDLNNGSNNDLSNSSPILLNSLASGYASKDSEFISAYLDQKAAGRFSYRFEAYWRPVEAFPMESRLIIGNEPPSNAIRQSVKLSMPLYASAPSRDALLACVNDSVLEAALNSSDGESSKVLFEAFNDSIDVAAQEGAQVVIGLLFPSNYFGSTFGSETDESFQTLLYGVSENPDAKNSSSVEKMFNTYFSNLLASGFQLDSGTYPENLSTDDLSLLKEQMALQVKNEIKTELESKYSGEINGTVYSICKTKDFSEAQSLRDSFIESVYRNINPGGARIVLSLWNPVT